jgi:hypothetical protein
MSPQDDLPTRGDQRTAQMAAEEAGAAGDEHRPACMLHAGLRAISRFVRHGQHPAAAPIHLPAAVIPQRGGL